VASEPVEDALVNEPDRELRWLRRLRELSHELAAEEDMERLFPRILQAAVELAGAERGFLVRLQPRPGGAPKVHVEVALGFDGDTLRGAAGKVSRTVVNRVVAERRTVLTAVGLDHELVDKTSVKQRRVRSIVAVPLRLRAELRGVLYLDHRFDADAFEERDVPCLEAFADQAAWVLETAELIETGQARALRQRHVERRLRALEREVAPSTEPPVSLPAPGPPGERVGLVGDSPAMEELRIRLDRLARAEAPVLILGESGTGKELVARELHRRRPAGREPFLCLDCAAMSEGVLESELFGHRRGAFTGAAEDRVGLLVRAGRGTLFVDDVADMSPGLQARLHRALQDRTVRRVGADESEPVRCRVIAATRRDLAALVEAGAFRADLYYRLDVLRLEVPPLRDRLEDVPRLVGHTLARRGRTLRLSPAALAVMSRYRWPGNVRELENEVQRLLARGVDPVLPAHLSPELRDDAPAEPPQTLQSVERALLLAALEECGGNKSRAARRLGLARSSFYALLRRHGLHEGG
jgi:transcriptional regulator with GAF, ATPase, and Fis domain